jgi:hypothetical protein
MSCYCIDLIGLILSMVMVQLEWVHPYNQPVCIISHYHSPNYHHHHHVIWPSNKGKHPCYASCSIIVNCSITVSSTNYSCDYLYIMMFILRCFAFLLFDSAHHDCMITRCSTFSVLVDTIHRNGSHPFRIELFFIRLLG